MGLFRYEKGLTPWLPQLDSNQQNSGQSRAVCQLAYRAIWLGIRDSNSNFRLQRPDCYHYNNPQYF